MKKIIALLVVTLGLGFSANAQQATKDVRAVQMTELDKNTQQKIKDAAAADAAELGKVITYKGTDKEMYTQLFETKHRMYAQNLTEDRKAYVASIVEKKLSAGLSPEDLQKVYNTPGLMKRLTGK